MRLSIKLYRVSCDNPEIVKRGIPYEFLADDPNIILDRSLAFKTGKMEILKDAEMEALCFEKVFHKNLLSKRKKGIGKWLSRKQYIKNTDAALILIRNSQNKRKILLLNKGERTDLFSITANLRYCGDGKFQAGGIL